ncbi:MAG: YdgA family protein [Sulfuricaulis sp.]|uniref:YdgA family protein n=1 Tax=Sulfuricaulis sp. TaxID=2003553 RepID=UPI0025E4DB3A|nr:YdgA family protein [Sulfuricaulis sp.]MCR4345784.1 YdgA family protein [Sulfuricaulis sp.]
MKKIVLATVLSIAATLVLIALALPFWFGLETEKTYAAMLDQLSRSSGLQFTGKNYERGWLSSTAESVIRRPEASFEIVARHHISHGPLPLDRVLEGKWLPAQAHITSQIQLDPPGNKDTFTLPPLTATTTFHFNGASSVHAELSPVKKAGAQGQIIDWRGMDADMTFDREWKKIRLDVRMPALALATPGKQGEFSLSKAVLHSDMHEGTAGYFFGDGALTIGQIEFGGATERVSLKGLEISTSAQPVGENVTLIIRYQIGEIRAGDERFGPGQLVMELRHLDAAALVKFKNEMDGLYRGNLPPPQAAMMLAGKGLELIGSLSKKAPELEITRLSFKTRDGEISGRAKFVLDGRKTNLTQNPMKLLTSLVGDVEVSIPSPVVKQMLAPQIRRDIETHYRNGSLNEQEIAKLDPAKMAAIVDQVFPQYLARNEFTRSLVEENGAYKLTLTLRQGQMLLNGKPIHLPTRAAVTL